MSKIAAATPIRDLFTAVGWHLEPGILELAAVNGVREFLDARRQQLQQHFSAWVGESVSDGNYAAHQGHLEEYGARNLPKDLRHFLRGEFDLQTRLDQRIMEVLGTPRCRAFLTGFLGSEQYFIHYPPMIRFKMARAESSRLPAHQDTPYNQHLAEFMTVWVPLVVIDDACGGVVVYEGSQRDGIVPHESKGAWENSAVADLTQYTPRHVLMNPGDILLFPGELLHASAPHRSERIRYSIDFRVIKRVEATTKSYYDPFARQIVRRD